jgi:hypothetical protein
MNNLLFSLCLCREIEFTERTRYQWNHAIFYLPLTLWPPGKFRPILLSEDSRPFPAQVRFEGRA